MIIKKIYKVHKDNGNTGYAIFKPNDKISHVTSKSKMAYNIARDALDNIDFDECTVVYIVQKHDG